MGGTGSGRYPSGSGRKPKKKKVVKYTWGGARPNSGGRREGAGRKCVGGIRRVPLNVTVAPATKRLLQSLVESEGISEGMAVDMLAEPYTLTDEEMATYLSKQSRPAGTDEPECQNKAVQGSLF